MTIWRFSCDVHESAAIFDRRYYDLPATVPAFRRPKAATVDEVSLPPYWLQLPFALATTGTVAMAFYALFINGSYHLRALFVIICGGLAPVMISGIVVGFLTGDGAAITSGDGAAITTIYRIGFALVPAATSAVLIFECALARQLYQYRWILIGAVVISLALATLALVSAGHIGGPWKTYKLQWPYFRADGWLVPVQTASSALWLALTALLLRRQLQGERDTLRRRQIKSSRNAVVALAIALIDIHLAYGIGVFPVSWLFFVAALWFLLRSLCADSLIDPQSRDIRGALVLAYSAAAAVGTWVVWTLVSGDSGRGSDEKPIVILAIVTMAVFLILRVLIALVGLTRNPTSAAAGTPLKRVFEQFSGKVQGLHEEREIGIETANALKLGLGCEWSKLLLPSVKDYSWETADGETLPEEALPDPLTFSWLLDHAKPIQRSELDSMRLGDLRKSIEGLFAANNAEVIVPLVSGEDMVGMLVLLVHKEGLVIGREGFEFLGAVAEQLSAALVYARMHREVNRRVAAHKEVELAAAVQRAFVPTVDLVECGPIQISGLWAPALQCGGDWWSVHQLPDGRVLVLIGDVTGHGVAAAMITAAAKGCYDVAERLMGNDFDLVRLLDLLDSSVRLVGADRLHMTCFATLLDPVNGTVEFANAGHVVPYICRPRNDGGVELGALVSRGNPLGSRDPLKYRAQTRDLTSGDVLVWYTDGIVECTNPDQKQFGERRLQRLLRKIDDLEANPRAVRDHIVRALVAFRKDQAQDDDITLVVARLA